MSTPIDTRAIRGRLQKRWNASRGALRASLHEAAGDVHALLIEVSRLEARLTEMQQQRVAAGKLDELARRRAA